MTNYQPEKKFEFLARKGFQLPEKNQKPINILPLANPLHNLITTFIVWNISIGQLGYLSGYALAQLPHTCSLAEFKKLEKSLIYSNNRKHQCYQNSSHTKSKTQQLLRSKLTLFQLKSGHRVRKGQQ